MAEIRVVALVRRYRIPSQRAPITTIVSAQIEMARMASVTHALKAYPPLIVHHVRATL